MEFDELLKTFGTKIGLPELAAEDNGICRLSLDGMIVDIKRTGDEKHILLFAQIVALPTERTAELERQILGGNFLFSATDGATLSLDTNSNQLCLQQQEALAVLDADSFSTLLEDFVNTIENWKNLITAYQQKLQNSDVEEESISFSVPAGIFRV